MRIGIFGGTFDPPHLGHLIVAGDAHAALGLDRLLLIPSAVPPHKHATVRTPAELRLAMVRAATRGDSRFRVDDSELRRSGPSYTVDTLRALQGRFPRGELFLLMGADSLRDLPTWREPDRIVRLARLAVLSRGGDEGAESHFSFIAVPVTRVDISATEIRRRVAAGRSIRYLVPDAARAIVEREGLYRNFPESNRLSC